MADWNGSLTLGTEQMAALDAFIHQPDTRKGDIFAQGTLPVNPGLAVDWIIKHDLFEGVVIHFSLMAQDGTVFLAGADASLSQAADLRESYVLEHEDARYHVTIAQA